jgi:modification methylase
MKALNDELQMRSDWVMPLCTGQERLKDDAGNKAHPTQKPEALLYRAILAATNPGDVVLDPFFGTGTTGAVAKKLGRRYIGIERDRNYVKVAEKRLARIPEVADKRLVETPSKRKEPRIPFGTLVERGMLSAGDVLVSPCGRFTAKVRADGTIISADHRGSIHQVGAAVQNAPSCNGWTYWCMNVEGRHVPIDLLRQKLRSEARA